MSFEPRYHSGFVSSSLLRSLIYERPVSGRTKKSSVLESACMSRFLSLTICEFSMNQKWTLLLRQRDKIGVMLDTVQEDCNRGKKILAETG